jgi:hypothetical protein
MVTLYENILSEDLYVEVLEYVKILMKEKSEYFTTSTLVWEKGLIGNSTPIVRYNFGIEDGEIFKKIKNEIENNISYFVDTFCLHIWPNLSYINWHDDNLVPAALTVYLNEKWHMDWGGYLMYKEDNEIKAIRPKKNLGILQENKVEHTVTTINTGADLRMSLQFFLRKNKKML